MTDRGTDIQTKQRWQVHPEALLQHRVVKTTNSTNCNIKDSQTNSYICCNLLQICAKLTKWISVDENEPRNLSPYFNTCKQKKKISVVQK